MGIEESRQLENWNEEQQQTTQKHRHRSKKKTEEENEWKRTKWNVESLSAVQWDIYSMFFPCGVCHNNNTE